MKTTSRWCLVLFVMMALCAVLPNSAIAEDEDNGKDKAKANDVFGELCGRCRDIDRTDGVRMTFDSDEIVHLRPSGNAPEFRCYNEAATADRAGELNAACMKLLESFRVPANI